MAGIADFQIDQGSTFSRVITLKTSAGVPIDLTGYTARGMIKASAQDVAALQSFTCTVDPDETTGRITISLTDVQTSALPATGEKFSELARFVYDIEIVDWEGKVTRILNGSILLSPEVTD